MPRSQIMLSRRRLLGSSLTVGAASVAAGAGTMAFFSDSESSTGNTITAGTVEIGFGSKGTFDFSTALAPTQSTMDSVTLVRTGTIAGTVDVDVTYTNSDANGNGGDVSVEQVAKALEVTKLTYGGRDLRGQINTTTSPPTLFDLNKNAHGENEATQNDLINLDDPGPGGTQFTVELRLKNVGDEYQGDGIAIEFAFHLNQTDAQ